MANDLSTHNTTVDLGNKIAIYDLFGWKLIAGTVNDDPTLETALAKFKENFRVVNDHRILGDPNDDFQNGATFIRLIERLSDGKVFGHVYAEALHNYGIMYINPNGASHDIFYEWDEDYYPMVYVFVPVKSFTVVGYEPDEDDH